MSHLQPVSLGRTESGIPGLFTHGYLAFGLTEITYEVLKKDREMLERFCKDRGFKLETPIETLETITNVLAGGA